MIQHQAKVHKVFGLLSLKECLKIHPMRKCPSSPPPSPPAQHKTLGISIKVLHRKRIPVTNSGAVT